MQTLNLLTRFALVLAVCAAAVGCSSSNISQTAGGSARVGTISNVQVNVLKGSLDERGEADFRDFSVEKSMRVALLSELGRRGKVGANGAAMEFTVTDFRLRSGAALFWAGVMAGGDHVAGTVKVKKGQTVVKSLHVEADGLDSMWSGVATGKLSGRSRAEKFCRMMAHDIAERL